MRAAKTNTLLIRTPEGITFSLLLASPVTRFLAYAIDLGCISIVTMFLGALLGFLNFISLDFARAVSTLGPRGYDEINQARAAGNFGWPYFIANSGRVVEQGVGL